MISWSFWEIRLDLLLKLPRPLKITLIWTWNKNSVTFKNCMSHCYIKSFACIGPNLSNLSSLYASKCHKLLIDSRTYFGFLIHSKTKKLCPKQWFCTIRKNWLCHSVTKKVWICFVNYWFPERTEQLSPQLYTGIS